MENHTTIKVFISYSHYDNRWLNRLIIHLTPLSRDFKIDIWSDRDIQTGTKWKQKIKQAIEDCDIAILLISPDFLASNFINTNELPPLIEAAEKEGKLIIPLIVSPSLFNKKSDIAQFQAINDPITPIIGMDEYKQENTFLKVAETILDRSIKLKDTSIPIEEDAFIANSFVNTKDWTNLIKIGNWLFDENNKRIIGSGLYSFLISRQSFGRTPFEINAEIQYSNFAQFGNKKDFINTGILFGWETKQSSQTYYNFLLTGKKLILERVGMKALEFAGQALKPFEHIDEGTSFELIENDLMKFKIVFGPNKISFYSDNSLIYKFPTPKFIIGRVGIRAWRCQLNISKFNINEIK